MSLFRIYRIIDRLTIRTNKTIQQSGWCVCNQLKYTQGEKKISFIIEEKPIKHLGISLKNMHNLYWEKYEGLETEMQEDFRFMDKQMIWTRNSHKRKVEVWINTWKDA